MSLEYCSESVLPGEIILLCSPLMVREVFSGSIVVWQILAFILISLNEYFISGVLQVESPFD